MAFTTTAAEVAEQQLANAHGNILTYDQNGRRRPPEVVLELRLAWSGAISLAPGSRYR